MGNAFLYGNSASSPIKGTDAEFIAQDKLKIGDIVYTVNGDITTTAYNTNLSGIYTSDISSDGKLLVIGGTFVGYAKLYSISDGVVTWLTNIYADNNNTALNNTVSSVSFLNNTTMFVLGGAFTDKVKLYSVSNNILTFISNIYADSNNTPFSNDVKVVSFSPNGSSLVVGGLYGVFGKIYSVNGTSINFISDIYADNIGTLLSSTVMSVSFSADGTKLVLGGLFSGRAKIYSVNGTSLTFINNIYADTGTTLLSGAVYTIAFSTDGTRLVLGGIFTGNAKIYSVTGTVVTFISNIYADTKGGSLLYSVYSAKFYNNNTNLFLGGEFTGLAKYYSVSGTIVTWIGTIFSDSNSTLFNNIVYNITFSKTENIAIIVGVFTNGSKLYSVSGSNILFINNIYGDNGSAILDNSVNDAAFSPDGTKLVLVGIFTGKAKLYLVDGYVITFIKNIDFDTIGTPFTDTIWAASFSADGTKLVLGGDFTGYARRYSVSGTTITFISSLYADAGTTALNGQVNGCAFSPDNTKLILTGQFTGGAKVYSISGSNVTFVSNIYADAGTTALSDVRSVSFSKDSQLCVITGNFTAKAKLYITSGASTVTFSKNIYADAGTTIFTVLVSKSAFSPDGTKLVLGGSFAGYAKWYSVSGTTITFISNIYADAGTTALNNDVRGVSFSADGTKLILTGTFTNYAKWYSISINNIIFGNNIYADIASNVFNAYPQAVKTSPKSNLLILGGNFSKKASGYIMSSQNILNINNVYKYKLNVNHNIPYYSTKVGYSKQEATINSNVLIKLIT